MKKFFLFLVMVFFIMTPLYADDNSAKNCDTISWLSKNTDDAVSIQNGNSLPLLIKVIVNGGGAGVNIQGCGNTTHINAGSSAMCKTSDSGRPVSFSSDRNDSATGTYVVQLNPLGS